MVNDPTTESSNNVLQHNALYKIHNFRFNLCRSFNFEHPDVWEKFMSIMYHYFMKKWASLSAYMHVYNRMKMESIILTRALRMEYLIGCFQIQKNNVLDSTNTRYLLTFEWPIANQALNGLVNSITIIKASHLVHHSLHWCVSLWIKVTNLKELVKTNSRYKLRQTFSSSTKEFWGFWLHRRFSIQTTARSCCIELVQPSTKPCGFIVLHYPLTLLLCLTKASLAPFWPCCFNFQLPWDLLNWLVNTGNLKAQNMFF